MELIWLALAGLWTLMLIAALAYPRWRAYQDGIAQGMQIGHAEGIQEGRRLERVMR